MLSNFLLTFHDKDQTTAFYNSKKKENIIASAVLLFFRFVFGVIIIINFAKGLVPAMRVYLHFSGQLWHLLAILLAWRFPIHGQNLHAC